MTKETMDLSMVPYSHMGSCKTETKNGEEVEEKPVEKNRRLNGEPVVEPVGVSLSNNKAVSLKVIFKYRECLRNHAASIGGHANDGCGEFMPGGMDDAREALRCAACGCHRNFHRKEVPGVGLLHTGGAPPPPPVVVYNTGGSTGRWEKKVGVGGGFSSVPALSLPLPHHQLSNGSVMFGTVDFRNLVDEMGRVQDRRSETPERGEVQVGMVRTKRYRTKFTQEQKDKMLEFAERLGWRIQKHDDVALSQFCLEIGVKRQVLKVWMHNNKNLFRKKDNGAAAEEATEAAAAPSTLGN